MERDRLGRRRQPEQQRGLRPLHASLPERWTSRALRVAMAEEDWARLEALALREAMTAPSQARAYGQVLSRLLRDAPTPPGDPGPLDWLDWERRKGLRLLSRRS